MSRNKTTIFISSLAFMAQIVLCTQTSSASELELPQLRQGYFFSVGAAGALQLNYDSEIGWLDPMPGFHLNLRIGEQLTSWFDIGIGFNYGQGWNPDYRSVVGGLTLEGQLYPTRNFFIRPGIGFSFTDITRISGKNLPKPLGRFGANYSVTLGYNIFTSAGKYGSGGFSITPIINAGVGPGSEYNTTIFMVGAEFTFWTGLSKDKLELPFEEAF